jgi:glycosyltransferase involved in cell wall biosynthesis
VLRIHHAVDSRLFSCGERKQRQIALTGGKNEMDSKQVLGLLRYHGVLEEITVVDVQDKSEAETAAILRESAIFLSFAEQEGCGLAAMEAMACGCITIGYDGNGGREFFHPRYALPIPPGDVIAFATVLERVINDLKVDRQPLEMPPREISRWILDQYTPEREAQDVIDAWRQIVDLPQMQQWLNS